MPRYEYKCATCKQEVTITARIDQTVTPPICIACAAVMKRNYSDITIKFASDGFYSTDKNK